MEPQEDPRVDLNLPCRLTSLRLGTEPLTAVTENISRGEILLVLPVGKDPVEGPYVGDPMIVEIDLPANHTFGRKCMQCQTTVIRVSRSEDGDARLTMRIHKIRFQNCAENLTGEALCEDSAGQLLM